MMIGSIRTTEINQLPGTSGIQEASHSATDVSFFNSTLIPSPIANTAVDHALPPNMLSEAAGKLNSMTERMTKSLRALSSKNKLDEARKYPGQLSDALLLTHMLSKSVGKTAQCIDKISNLQ